MVYVTHDQTEAMTLADRIVVLHDGYIEQIGTPMELYNNPANKFVAGFIGSPQMNFIDAEYLDVKDAKTVGIRPEHIALDAKVGDISGKVTHVEQLGGDTNVYLDCGDAGQVSVRLFGQHDVEIDSTQFAKFESDKTFYFDDAGMRMI